MEKLSWQKTNDELWLLFTIDFQIIKMCIKSKYFSRMTEYYDAMLGRQGINGQNTRKNKEKSDFGIT